MVLGDADLPFFDGQVVHLRDDLAALAEVLLRPTAAEDERTGVGRVGQEVMDRRIRRIYPADVVRAGGATRQTQTVGAKRQEHLACGAELVEAREDDRDRLGHRLVATFHDPIVLVVVEPDG